jgi:hypothetical protein
MNRLEQGLLMLAVSVVFAGWIWWNRASSAATLRWPIEADRAKNPIGFWLIQGLLGLFALGFSSLGLAVLFGPATA